MPQMLKLPERLSVIAGFIKKNASVIDVGTDHGFLPVYLAQNYLTCRIIATDISEGSLSAARRTASKHGVTDRIKFVQTPGLEGLQDLKINTIVIAGLGGETIAEILAGATWIIERKIKLILQPQSKIDELCGFLRLYGYVFNDAEIVRDNGRYYVVMVANTGKSDLSLLSPEIELYSMLAKKNNPMFINYLDTLINKTQSTATASKSSNPVRYGSMLIRLEELRSIREEAVFGKSN